MKTIHALIILVLTAPFSPAQTPASSWDPFKAESVWEGNRRFEKDNGKLKKGSHGWSLTITKRSGTNFEGFITIASNLSGKDAVYAVVGTAPTGTDGPVRFKSERSGDFQQSFSGKLKNGIITLDFQGKSAAGEPVEGIAALTPKN